MSARLRGDGLPLAVAVGTALTIATAFLTKLFGGYLGARYAPFYVQVEPEVNLLWVPALVAMVAGLFMAPRLLSASVGGGLFAVTTTGVTLGMQLALNGTRGGAPAWHAVFSDFSGGAEAHHEYLPALPALRHGVGVFLDLFAQTSSSLPIHPSAHPPGMILTLHWLGIDSGQGMAALTIGAGALNVPLVYWLGRRLLDDHRARVAALFYAFAPSALLYGATSADVLFATLGTAAAAGLLAGRWTWRVAGGGLLAVASFFSYALLGVGAWVTLVAARRDGWRPAARLACVAGLLLVAFYVSLYLIAGFDLIASLDAAEGAYRRSIASKRPYLFWLFGSPAAFLVALGLPLSWLALRAAAARNPAAVALVAVLALSAVLGFTKAETERIWQFYVPLACLAAAGGLRDRFTAVLVALAAQAVTVQLLLNTRW